MQKNWALGFTLALITVTMWGLLPIALKGLLSAMDVITITWYRFSVSALIALIWYGRQSKSTLIRLFSPPNLALTVLAVVGLLCNYKFYLSGLHDTTAGTAQIVIQLAPLLLLLGSVILFKEKFSVKQWLGMIIFCIGILLFFNHRLESLTNTGSTYLRGIMWLVIAAICWATYGLAQKSLIKSESSTSLLFAIYIAGTIVFFPAATPSQAMELSPIGWGLLIFASLNTIVAYNSFGLAMTYWDTSRVSATLALTPLFTLVFAQMLALWQPQFMEFESLGIISWIGALLLISGSFITALSKS